MKLLWRDSRKLVLFRSLNIQKQFMKESKTRVGRHFFFVDCVNIVLCLKKKYGQQSWFPVEIYFTTLLSLPFFFSFRCSGKKNFFEKEFMANERSEIRDIKFQLRNKVKIYLFWKHRFGPNFWSDKKFSWIKLLIEHNFSHLPKFSHFCPTKFCPVRYLTGIVILWVKTEMGFMVSI